VVRSPFTSRIFRTYLLPGLVFQSLITGGGYGTGRELVEFFLQYGPLGGLLGMALAITIWSVVCALTFELARATGAYDYRAFTQQLLGRGWGLYEACYLTMTTLILAVMAAATGSILEEIFGLPYLAGALGMVACIGFFVFKGTPAVERFLSTWSFVLYANYAVFLLWCLARFGGDIGSSLAAAEVRPGWLVGGIKYGANNIGVLPAMLFVVRHFTTRKEALGAGLLAGPLGISPGLLFYLAMLGQYPQVVDQAVPSDYLLALLGSRAFRIIFQIALLGSIIDTGTAMIHAVNERINGRLFEQGRTMPAYLRPSLAVALLLVASLLARFGLIDLIAQGYGTVAWGFLLLFVVPVLTLGAYRVFVRPAAATPAATPQGAP
jgi:uncharacterized membrane protein YkvI